jgi:uncharacterized DUF497 family protein
MAEPSFEWDEDKNRRNQEKHGVAFELAQLAFFDERRVIAEDFTWRAGRIRIFGAGYWRKGKRIYERENKTV